MDEVLGSIGSGVDLQIRDRKFHLADTKPCYQPARRFTVGRRAAWYRDYIETLVQRDVRGLARIPSRDALPRLLVLAAGQTARLRKLRDAAGKRFVAGAVL